MHEQDALIPDLAMRITVLLRKRGAWCVLAGAARGVPDVLACYKGRFLALAVIGERGPQPSPRRRRELALLDRAGAVTLVVRSVGEVRAILDDLDRNPPEILALERLMV
jgi:hypothetical protein